MICAHNLFDRDISKGAVDHQGCLPGMPKTSDTHHNTSATHNTSDTHHTTRAIDRNLCHVGNEGLEQEVKVQTQLESLGVVASPEVVAARVTESPSLGTLSTAEAQVTSTITSTTYVSYFADVLSEEEGAAGEGSFLLSR